ncbi:MAG: DNA polymerase IV, partial [Halanaerobium sp.]
FSTVSRQISLKNNLNSTELIYKTGKKLIKDNKLFKKPLRLLGIGVSNLSDSEKMQLNLFEKQTVNSEIDQTIDDIKRKYGFDKISRARKLYLKNNNEQ